MRVGEIAALKVSDVCDSEGVVRDHNQLNKDQTNGSEARTVLLNVQAQEELLLYSRTLSRTGDDPVFVSKWSKATVSSRFSADFTNWRN